MISAWNTNNITLVLFHDSMKTFAVNLAMLLILLSKLTTLACDSLTVSNESSERQLTSFATLLKNSANS